MGNQVSALTVVLACLTLSVSMLSGGSLGEPEPILALVDLHFTSQGIETTPTGPLHVGAAVKLASHIALEGSQNWTKKGIVVDRGSGGDPDSGGLAAPSVLHEDGEYKLWYEGWDGPFPTSRILYANSSDGITWNKRGVVLSFGGSGEDYSVHYPFVMRDGGTYKMWYSGYDAPDLSGNWRIFYATSPDGLTWTKHGLVLDLGTPGSYDDMYAYNPFVLLDGVYKMWYGGNDGSNVRLLYATSPDGETWTKQGLALDLGPPGSLEDVHVSSNYVMKEGGGYHMWYRGSDSSHNRIFYRISQDGLVWTSKTLVLDVGSPGATDSVHVIHQSILHLAGNLYQMWYQGRDEAGVDRIHYANLTSIPLPANVEVSFYLDGVTQGNLIGVNVTRAGALSLATAEISWRPMSLGHHYIYAVIDPSNGITETNEGNNTVFLQVDVINNPPVANAGPDQTVFRNQMTALDGTGSVDPDGNPLTFFWVQTGGSPVLMSGGNTSTPSLFPHISGVYAFTLTVYDDWGGFSTDSVNVTVVNRPPTADAGADRVAAKRSVVQLNGTKSSDPDGDVLAFNWTRSSGPTAMLLGVNQSVAYFIPPKSGTYSFSLTVDDGDGGTSTDTVQVTVTNGNPVASAGEDRTVLTNTLVILDSTDSSDPDGDALSFSWTQTSGPSVTLSRDNTATPRFTPTAAGEYTFKVMVDDGDGGTANDTIVITVNEPVSPPPTTSLPVEPWLLIIVIIVLLIVVLMLLFERRKWKKRALEVKGKEDEETRVKDSGSSDVPPPTEITK